MNITLVFSEVNEYYYDTHVTLILNKYDICVY